MATNGNKKENDYVVALDIGTSKVVCLIGQLTDSHAVEIVALGSYPSSGLKKGVVVNIDAYEGLSAAHREALDSSIDEAIAHYLKNYGELLEKWDSILVEKNVQKVMIDPAVIEEFKAAAAVPARDAWIADMSAQGLPAQDLYDLVQKTLAASK